MSVQVRIEEIQAQLQKIREQHGEEVYQKARLDLAQSVILGTNGEAFVRNAFPDMDVAELRASAEARRATAQTSDSPSMDPGHVMLRLLQQQVPSIRTQAHFNVFSSAFDALRTTLDGYFTGDLERAQRGRDALNKALDTAGQVKDIVEKLEEIPEADRSERAKEYTEPPRQFHEYDNQRQLLVELEGLTTLAALSKWYADTKPARDRITAQSLRNELHDKIRDKRTALAAQEQN